MPAKNPMLKLNNGIEIARGDIFVTTKLWISDYGYERTLHAFERSRRKLGLEYVDLYLLHWPVPTDFEQTVASYKLARDLAPDPTALAEFLKMEPIGRQGAPEEIAAAVLWLGSPGASFVLGHSLLVDGGYTVP